MKPYSRRQLLKRGVTLAGLSALALPASAAILTPRATEGPYYPRESMRFDDVDNDLVKVEGQLKEAGGDIIYLKGKVLSTRGEPLVGYRVEIWQCDVNGKYMHPRDGRRVVYDNGFQGFGYDLTDAEGNYQFRTIKPTIYPGRTPHIHVKVFKGDRELLTTQFYIAGHPNNSRDGIFRRLSSEQAETVSMVFNQEGGQATTYVNLVV